MFEYSQYLGCCYFQSSLEAAAAAVEEVFN